MKELNFPEPSLPSGARTLSETTSTSGFDCQSGDPGRRVAVVVLACIGIMLLPLLVAYLSNIPSTLSVSIPVAFSSICLLAAGLHFTQGHHLSTLLLLTTLTVATLQVLPLWLGSVLGDILQIEDLIAAAAKPLSFLVFVALFDSVRLHVSHLVYFCRGFVTLVAVTAVFGVLTGLDAFFDVGLGVSSYSIDYSSFLANRNQFGMLLFLGFSSLLLARAIDGPRKHDRAVAALLFLSLLLTMSRGSILATTILIVMVVGLLRPATFVLIITPIVSALFLLVLLSDDARTYILHFFIRPEVGLSGRGDLWAIGVQLFSERPLTGYGFFQAISRADAVGMDLGQFHNFWVEQLVDWGLLGTGLLVSIFGVVWSRAYTKCPPAVRRVLLGAASGTIVLGMVESIGVLSVGFVDAVWTLCLLTVPILLSNASWNDLNFSEMHSSDVKRQSKR